METSLIGVAKSDLRLLLSSIFLWKFEMRFRDGHTKLTEGHINLFL